MYDVIWTKLQYMWLEATRSLVPGFVILPVLCWCNRLFNFLVLAHKYRLLTFHFMINDHFKILLLFSSDGQYSCVQSLVTNHQRAHPNKATGLVQLSSWHTFAKPQNLWSQPKHFYIKVEKGVTMYIHTSYSSYWIQIVWVEKVWAFTVCLAPLSRCQRVRACPWLHQDSSAVGNHQVHLSVWVTEDIHTHTHTILVMHIMYWVSFCPQYLQRFTGFVQI